MTTWSLRSPASELEVAAVFAADFAAVCKAEGDMRNYYRWRMVLQDIRQALAVQAYVGKPYSFSVSGGGSPFFTAKRLSGGYRGALPPDAEPGLDDQSPLF